MFERPHKNNADKAHLHGLTTMLPPAQLILKHKRPDIMAIFAETSQLKPMQFGAFCEALSLNLLHYLQQLPDTTNSYFSSPGGAFDHALSRTEAANELFRGYLLENPDTKLSEEQQLWWYALFSAGLLRGVGKLVLDYEVDLYNAQGRLIKRWEPLQEPLTKTAFAYKFDTINLNRDDTFRRRLNIILAKQLMPAEGFAWISQNLDVLETWLALLHEETESSGTLGLILDRADAVAIQDNLINPPHGIRTTTPVKRAITSIHPTEEELIIREQLTGTEFLKWMLACLESGKLTLNQHPLLNVPGGTLIGPDAFKLFVREHPQFKNWLAVQRGVTALGITRESLKDEGVILKSSIGLPNKLSHKASAKAGVELTDVIDALGARKQLSANGHWQAVEKSEAHPLSPKSDPYG